MMQFFPLWNAEKHSRRKAMSEISGYRYEIVRMSPGSNRSVDHADSVECFDRLSDAQEVLTVLEKYNFTYNAYALLMHPVWSKKQESSHD